MSVITVGELRKGIAVLSEDSSRRAVLERWFDRRLLLLVSGRVLPVTLSIAEQWGELEGERQMQGRPLNTADGLIAATALEHGLTLATRNVRDFEGLGVPIINPWEDQSA